MKKMFFNKKTKKNIMNKDINIQNDKYNTINNEIMMSVDYDGKIANLYVDTNRNGIKKHIDMKLTNNDLSRLLSVPSVNSSLDKRLSNILKGYNNELNFDINNIERNLYTPIVNLKKTKSKYNKTKKIRK